jgi:hypothetical protein
MIGANGPILTRKEKINKLYDIFKSTECYGVVIAWAVCSVFLIVLAGWIGINVIIAQYTCDKDIVEKYSRANNPIASCTVAYMFAEIIILLVIGLTCMSVMWLYECIGDCYRTMYKGYSEL